MLPGPQENVYIRELLRSLLRVFLNIRRDKLNSQFIVTKFSILHAGGRSLSSQISN